jgi:hypothetical protein
MPAVPEGPSHPIGERWRGAVGSARSLVIYYGNPMRQRRMDRLYSSFVREGDLVFDIGSHVGDRIGSFRRLAARLLRSSRSQGWSEYCGASTVVIRTS